MKALATFFLLVPLTAIAAPASPSAADTYEWLVTTRDRINLAGVNGDTIKLNQIRGQINSRLARWSGQSQHPCARALGDMRSFLIAVDAGRSRAVRQEVSRRFQDRLDMCGEVAGGKADAAN